nr:hypothetical protein 5 [Coxiellaceae bacterium]
MRNNDNNQRNNNNNSKIANSINPVKNGIKTTEFWATTLGSILVAGAAEFGIDLSQAAAISVTTMIVTYVVGRFFHKNKHLKPS